MIQSRQTLEKIHHTIEQPTTRLTTNFIQQIKEAHEQASFFNDLTAHVDEFPKAYSRHKILPQLLNVFQYGNAGPSVLPPLFKVSPPLYCISHEKE